MTEFTKPALSVAQQIDQLVERGLVIADRAAANRYLSVISYYRLSAYTLPFQIGNPDHRFRPGADFNAVLELYVFDRELRLLLLDAIERIEVALRASMTNVLAMSHGPHGYLDPSIFDTRYDHPWLLEQLRRKCDGESNETFIAHYRRKYSRPEFPPVWMAMEILTFKEVSVLFSRLRDRKDKQAISHPWGLDNTVLRSWFRSISDLRNICAHHSRTWNREFGSRPLVPKKTPARWPDLTRPLADPRIDPTRRLYYQIVVIEYLLQRANPESSWHHRLRSLLDRHPNVSRAHMGMSQDWWKDTFWRFE